MSFKHKGVLITMNNYLEVFKDFEPDILDEIRSAVLDDTPISPFIRVCGCDSYKLGQFRMALREYVPKEYLNSQLSGRCIYLIRRCFKDGIDLNPILRYIKGSLKLESDSLEKIIQAIALGIDIRKVDFTSVPKDNLGIICEGLLKGYPMWLCVSEEGYLTPSFIRQLMKGMHLQVDIHPFLNGKWSEDQLIFLLSNARGVNINTLLEYVNYKFSVDHLVEIVDLARDNLDYTPLCLQEEDGSPVFNIYQLAVLGTAIREGLLTDELYNPRLSDMEMQDILNDLIFKRNSEKKPKLGGSLRK